MMTRNVKPLLCMTFFTCLLVASGDSVLQCTNRTIEGKDGDRVILPCSQTNKTDLSNEEVIWKFKDKTTGEKIVHVYFQGKDFPHKQSDDFKERTSLFKEELSSGNCSLSLLVNTSHSGRYYSCVGGILCCTVRLKVLSKGTNDTSQKHQDVPVSPDKPNNVTDGLTKIQQDNGDVAGAVIGGLLVVVLVALIALGFYCYRKRLKQPSLTDSSGMTPNKSQISLEVPVQTQQPPQDEEKQPQPADPNQNEEQRQMIENEDQDDPADGNKLTPDN